MLVGPVGAEPAGSGVAPFLALLGTALLGVPAGPPMLLKFLPDMLLPVDEATGHRVAAVVIERVCWQRDRSAG